ncbi:hypothetical protein PAXINDRAFT_10268 [Paxillus involutus ATCC 200175]|nr:hypothetical protein PAXINDRAFT_10268 [Paxillus involutus ATCC 200175]
MPRRDKASQSPKKYKQKTLIGFLNSSPPSSPGPSKRKREPIPPPTHLEVEAGSEDSDVGAIHFEPEIMDISDEDQSPRRPKRKKSIVVTDTIPERELSDDSLEENIKMPVRWKGKKGKAKAIHDSEEDAQPRRRKLIKGVRPPTPQEDSVLDEVDENQILESRFRARGKLSAFQKNLEKLKSLKGKKRSDMVLESSSSEAEVPVAPFKGAKPHRSGESNSSSHDSDESLEDDEDDFIVDDDAHGAPATKLPVAFSMNTHQDLTHHFKIICQLFVHMAVRPLSERCPFLKHVLKEEEYFSVPLQVTRRKLFGLRDSLVASSVWRPGFKKALETYPEFTLVRMTFAIPQCDACHLGGRLSTLLGRVSGEPYDVYDFEDTSDKESNEYSDGDEDEDMKRDVKREFHLGRFCATRAQVYHQFNHWEHSLYKSLQQEIANVQDKNNKFIKVAYIGGIKPPRDLHDADKVMDWLDQRGVIDIEWQKVRQMMDSARNLEISAKRELIDGADS